MENEVDVCKTQTEGLSESKTEIKIPSEPKKTETKPETKPEEPLKSATEPLSRLEIGQQIQLLTLLTHSDSATSLRRDVQKLFSPGEVHIAFDFEAMLLLSSGVNIKTLSMLNAANIYYTNFLPNGKLEYSGPKTGFDTRCIKCLTKCHVPNKEDKVFNVKSQLQIRNDNVVLFALPIVQFFCSQTCYDSVQKQA
jgi:hypothetical protein